MKNFESLVREHYVNLTEKLIEKNMTITTMESATSGQLASLITDTEGSSAIFKGGFITYCNEAKIRYGVPEEIINKYSVYSKETAAAMAKACRESYAADIGVGITGTMGNTDPANCESSVPGKLYFAISAGDGTACFERFIPPQKDRLAYKLFSAEEVCKELLRIIR